MPALSAHGAAFWITVASLFVAAGHVNAGAILFVDADAMGANNGSTWDDAYTDLQAALRTARERGGIQEIWVAEGTYKPSASGGDRAISFDLVDGVSVFGGFAGGETSRQQRNPRLHPTVLSGDLNGDDELGPSSSTCCTTHAAPGCDDAACQEAVCAEDPFCCREGWDRTCVLVTMCSCGNLCSSRCENSLHVVRAIEVGETTVFDGFLITGGNASGISTTGGRGGGMLVSGGGPIVADCVFFDNQALMNGGGLFSTGSPQIYNCTFVGNSGGAGGGVGLAQGTALVANSVWSGNTASDSGGAVSNVGATLRLVNCTIFGNVARTAGGLSASGGARTAVDNCIFWDNRDNSGDQEFSQIRSDFLSELAVNFSDVKGRFGAFSGIGNIASNPLFADPLGPDQQVGTADDDLRITPGSPCIDAGSSARVPTDGGDLDGDGDRMEILPIDRDGRARFFDDPDSPNTGQGPAPIVDMGAYETAADCNENGVLDDQDVADQTSEDCNENRIPDECEIRRESPAPGGPFYCDLDCDPDCDENGLPDNCQPDADGDRLIDLCDECDDTPPGVPVDEDGCSLPGPCCFGNGCLGVLSDAACALIRGEFLGYGLTCNSDPDDDQVLGCADRCPHDPLKIRPGICGCGVPDDDTDRDGVADCHDRCPRDNPDDSDGDGICNSEDACPFDADGDTDGDGVCNADDPCPIDNPDDRDGDGTCTSQDGCPDDPNKIAPGICGCGRPDVDTDVDGVLDCNDECPETPLGMNVDDKGCPEMGACCFELQPPICAADAPRDICFQAGGVYQGNQTTCGEGGEGCAFAGDLNRDSRVNLSDLAMFIGCLRGPRTPISRTCGLADFNRDNRADLLDIAAFQSSFDGP